MKRTALERRTELRRRAWITRTPFVRRRPNPASAIPSTVRTQVVGRSRGWCEWPSCTEQATDMHHLLMRSQGGTHTVANLRHLCRRCHDRIHANPDDSYASGWLRHNWQGTPT